MILLLFGYPLIVGWWSMLLLPITLPIFFFLRRWQDHEVFDRLDIHPPRDTRGFLGYVLAYQILISAAAIRGYSPVRPRSRTTLEIAHGASSALEFEPDRMIDDRRLRAATRVTVAAKAVIR